MRRIVLGALLLGVGCGGGAGGPAPSAPSVAGLVASYRDGARAVTLVVPTPNFALERGESIHPQLGPEFDAVWSGQVRILRSGTYTFHGDADVRVNGAAVQGRPVVLAAGDHPIEIRRTGGGRFRLEWESDAFRREPVPGKAFLTGPRRPATSTEDARDLVEERNCMACHSLNRPTLRGRRGPDLTHIGSRTNLRWLVRWLGNPRHFRSGAVMPAMLDDAQKADVAAYLMTMTDPKDRAVDLPTDRFRIRQGAELFDATGCGACHKEPGLSLDGMGSKMDAGRLAKYLLDPLSVDPSGRMPHMFLSAEEASLIAEYLVQSRNPEFEAETPAGEVDRGRRLVASKGCVSCHQVGDLADEFKQVPILRTSAGCLADEPPPAAPRFGLTSAQRAGIRAFLEVPDVSPAPPHEYHRGLRTFRCTACHEHNESVPEGLAELPPPLSDAGNKLRAGWLRAVLVDRKRIRPWMALRMPDFGEANVGHLVKAFAAAAGAPPGDGDPLSPPTADEIRAGLRLLGKGDGGMSCIGCHDFKENVSLGTRGPDLTEMAHRMRPEWFRRWMRAPIRIQPGTAMPTFFDGVAEREAEATIDALWACLQAGKALPLPPGLAGKGGYLLLVKDEPIVVRTMMPQSSPRSIAVGFPGFQSICFDAEACRLRYLWSGDFLDMAPVWAGRGGTPARILGQRTWTAPREPPLRSDFGKEPELRFLGYAPTMKGVEFRYAVDDVEVTEAIDPLPENAGIRRTFTLPEGRTLWIMAGESKDADVSLSSGAFEGGRARIQGTVTVTVKVRK